MQSKRLDVRAKIDTDFCKKGEVISMKEGVFNEYHKNNFEIVGEKKKEEKIPTKKNKAMKVAKNK